MFVLSGDLSINRYFPVVSDSLAAIDHYYLLCGIFIVLLDRKSVDRQEAQDRDRGDNGQRLWECGPQWLVGHWTRIGRLDGQCDCN